MRIHENGGKTGYRSDSTCGYCREQGHNQYQCPKVKSDMTWFKCFQIPLDANGQVSRSGWYGAYPDTWGKWYEHCTKTYNIIIAREEAAKKKGATTPRKSSPRKCGFCGSKKHTRRKCDTMKQFVKDCHSANVKWRTAAYKELVEQHGISVGAAVQLEHDDRSYWQQQDNEGVKILSGIIISINWDTLTVFTALEKRHEDVHSALLIKVLLSNGSHATINSGFDQFKCLGTGGAKPSRYSYGEKFSLKSVIASSKQPLGEEWINGYKGAFDTLTKKRSLHQLEHGMDSMYNAPDLVDHIDAWK